MGQPRHNAVDPCLLAWEQCRPITDLDIAHREKLIEMSTHKKPSRQEAVNSLVDETLEPASIALWVRTESH